MEVIETERLVLRQQTLEDAAFILTLMNDLEWLRYIGDRGVRTHKEARAYIQEGALKMYDRHGFGLYLIELKGDRTPVGICGLIKRDSLDEVDLGFALARASQGNGYAREAAAATVAYARDVVGLRRVVAIVSPDNTDSLRLLEGLGFSFERFINYPTHTAMTRTHARAPKGQRAFGSVPRNRGGNLTLLAALSNSRIQAEWLIEGSVDGDVFVTWVEHVLLPTLTPGQTVVMDNLRAHYRKEVRTLVEARGCNLLYLPPYSPDFSPIELAFSKIKGRLKSLAARTKQALADAVAKACRTVSSADVAGWFRHCGYNLQ